MISFTRGRVIAGILVVFLLGMLAGSGLGTVYGRNARIAEDEQRLAERERQLQTANDNYLILVREYNKLFGLRSATVASVSAEVQPAAAAAQAVQAAPAPAAPVATVEATPTEASVATIEAAPTEAPLVATAAPTSTSEPTATSAVAGQPWADFEARSRTGAGPLEGPPPQTFDFTDLSSGQITSWSWDFGDGGTSTAQNPEHTYTECPDDLCTVTLTVCGPGGCDTKTKLDYLHVSASCAGC